MPQYTYEQYLGNWVDWFGDADIGCFEYWQHGKKHYKQLRKMSKPEFKRTLSRFDRLTKKYNNEIGVDYQWDDPEKNILADRLLAQSFECELPLFF